MTNDAQLNCFLLLSEYWKWHEHFSTQINKKTVPDKMDPCQHIPDAWAHFLFLTSCPDPSAGEGSGDHQVLPLPGQARRLGVGAELRHHRPQQPLLAAPLHRQRQLRPDVSVSITTHIHLYSWERWRCRPPHDLPGEQPLQYRVGCCGRYLRWCVWTLYIYCKKKKKVLCDPLCRLCLNLNPVLLGVIPYQPPGSDRRNPAASRHSPYKSMKY